MQKNSVAKKYVLILIFSLLPFIIGIAFSLFHSSDRAYYSAAINISGSQRMRTMLLSNYSQQYVSASYNNDKDKKDSAQKILLVEREIYDKFYNALFEGEESLSIKQPDKEDVKKMLLELKPQIENYLTNIEKVMSNYKDTDSLNDITENAMKIKDQYHILTEMFQKENDSSIQRQRMLDILMIILGALITISGLLMTNRIKQQEYHAYFDFLTKLKNRHCFYHDIKDKEPTKHSVFFIDLNKFKIINDTYGHLTGDEILIGVAQKLRDTFDSELLYRFGGDEFVAIIPASAENLTIDERINALKVKLAEPIIDSSGRKHFVGLALGVVSYEVGIADWDTLISLSDDLMYDSKSIPGHVIVYRTKSDLDYRIKLINSVDKVFKNGLIKLNYSLIECLQSGNAPIFNVSSRWVDGNQIFRAKEFLPLLKRKGYLPMLDRNTITQLEYDLFNSINQETISTQNESYIISITEDTLINSHENQFIEIVSNININLEQVYIKVQDEWLNNQGLISQLNLLKEKGFKVALDLNKLELTLSDSNQYKMVNLIKLGNGLVQSLMISAQTRLLMREFVNWLTDMNMIVVLEGLTMQEDYEIIHNLEFRQERLIYIDSLSYKQN